MAPATFDKPDAKIAVEKVEDAIVDPAVEEAVAKDIIMPEIGANKNWGILRISNNSIVLCCKLEDCIIPTKVPVPNNSRHIPCILFIPKAISSLVFLVLLVAIILTIAPTGKAIKGSIVMLEKFPKDNNTIEVQGPIIEQNKLGSVSCSSFKILKMILLPLLDKSLVNN